MNMLTDKKAIITGGASGIGEQTVRLFLEQGASVVIADVNVEKGEALADELGDGVHFCSVDLSDADQIEAMVGQAVETLGGLDILVNNAGFGGYGRTHLVDPAFWQLVMDVNLNALFHTCRHCIPHMMEKGGSIVNTASVSGTRADYGFNAYSAAKGGVLNYTRNLALDYAEDNIRANAVSPGFILTPLTGVMQGNPEIMQTYLDTIPMGRAGQPEEIAQVILFLASDLASFVTGQELAVDGGVTAWNGQPRFTRILGDITIP
jgi:meso-butanediol dehydrogenase/(S,S)-butanediol dehydrogenase/diacetyl reductase